MYSLGLVRHSAKRRTEFDFLIIAPRGVFVLRKGGRVRHEAGEWVLTDDTDW